MQFAPLSSPRIDLAVGCCHWFSPYMSPLQLKVCMNSRTFVILGPGLTLTLTAASPLCRNMQLFRRQVLQGSWCEWLVNMSVKRLRLHVLLQLDSFDISAFKRTLNLCHNHAVLLQANDWESLHYQMHSLQDMNHPPISLSTKIAPRLQSCICNA